MCSSTLKCVADTEIKSAEVEVYFHFIGIDEVECRLLVAF